MEASRKLPRLADDAEPPRPGSPRAKGLKLLRIRSDDGPRRARTRRPRQVDFSDLLRRPGQRGVPKYLRLEEVLLELIRNGHWRAGDKLPSEDQLVAETPFSLGTVQRALRELVEKRVLVRQHGKGTFVAHLPRRMTTPWHCQFLDDSGAGFLPVYSKAIERRLVGEKGSWSDYLPATGKGWLQIDRLFSINHEFLVFGRFYCDPATLRYFVDCPLGRLAGLNFLGFIVRDLSIRLTTLSHCVSLIEFPTGVSRMIQVGAGTVGMLVRATARAGSKFVYYQEFFIPPSRRQLYFSEDFEAGQG